MKGVQNEQSQSAKLPAGALEDLIRKLETATGPTKELDRAIARLIGWHRVEPRHARNRHGAWISPDEFLGVMSDGSPVISQSMDGTTMHRDVPDFTASIDAAVALAERVLPGHGRMGAKGRCTPQEPLYGYQIYRSDILDDGAEPALIGEAEHESEPICLVLATLRALRSIQEQSQ